MSPPLSKNIVLPWPEGSARNKGFVIHGGSSPEYRGLRDEKDVMVDDDNKVPAWDILF